MVALVFRNIYVLVWSKIGKEIKIIKVKRVKLKLVRRRGRWLRRV